MSYSLSLIRCQALLCHPIHVSCQSHGAGAQHCLKSWCIIVRHLLASLVLKHQFTLREDTHLRTTLQKYYINQCDTSQSVQMTVASQYRLEGQHADTSETRKPTLVEQGAVTPKKFL